MNTSVPLTFRFGVIALAALMQSVPHPAAAQLGGLGSLGKKPKEAAQAVDPKTFAASLTDVSGQVLTARITFIESKMILSEALGLKTESYVKASEALRLKEGATSSSGDKVAALSDSRKTTAEADKELAAKMEKSDTLSDESKIKFAEGSAKFIEGVIQLRAQVKTVQQLAEQGKAMTASANVLEKAKVVGLVAPAGQLASSLPGDVKEGTGTLGKIMSFAKRQNVTIPNGDKAESALGEL